MTKSTYQTYIYETYGKHEFNQSYMVNAWGMEICSVCGASRDNSVHLCSTSAEQQARDLLERYGLEGAQSFSSGDVVELANLIDNSHVSPNEVTVHGPFAMLFSKRYYSVVCGDVRIGVDVKRIRLEDIHGDYLNTVDVDDLAKALHKAQELANQ